MFDTSRDQDRKTKRGILKHGVMRNGLVKIGISDKGELGDPDALKQHCLESASLWVLKRRANLPNTSRQCLPAVARGG